jgi:16S rRNA (guanine(966)-N(2))-methyltransferase RsmD
MRITGGEYCGRTVSVPKGKLEIRPSMDRMRQSIFGILGDLEGMSFLDLFTGTGIIGLEASSRGADPVVCVEKDPGKRSTLIENVGIARKRIECHIIPVELFVKRCKESFDLIFCDPPFPYRFRLELLGNIVGGKILKPHGRLLMHRPAEDPMPDTIGEAVLVDRREYGRSIVDIYQKNQENAEPRG